MSEDLKTGAALSDAGVAAAGAGGDKPLITLEDAREIVMLLEAGMQQEADKKLLAITQKHEESFYQQVGCLTRDLHTAVQKFAYDPRLREITDEEIPNASERLRYIITVTDKAATRTLDAVDKCTPIALALKSSIDDLMPIWKHLMNGRIDRFEFVFLCHRIDDLLKKTASDASDLSNQLNEILMAQDFQDLTGQMIQRVVGLITEVEDKLVEFLRFFGQYTPVQDQERMKQKAIEAQGPALGSQIEDNTAAASQDEVDDLLASLGF
ncbi:MAG TPA: protein phosphatase CheZ [Candidatus Anaerobiospirillum pullistercoris]|uniref:Protein phosphatase CheZ n=1 Tax=Candidatus Anaerobiospirillum pullistercoris TaxID=2838452 RepID=A0A9D2B242_9GAMM|nr:protein phosphatase CheZ [Candidatus Anaerobiospirillum pullistercoris]